MKYGKDIDNYNNNDDYKSGNDIHSDYGAQVHYSNIQSKRKMKKITKTYYYRVNLMDLH